MEDRDIATARRELRELKKIKGIAMSSSASASNGDQSSIELKWQSMLNQLEDLSVSTVRTNNELSARVAELEEELAVWKQARSQLIGECEREKQRLENEVNVLQRRISEFEVSQDSMILCVIDGDGNIFNNSLLASGLEGGREAGRVLTKGIEDYLRGSDFLVTSRGRITIWLTMYFNKRGLQDILLAHNVCSLEQFEGFLTGFSQASPRFSLVDVGPGKEAADAKIKEYLQTYARFPQTSRIFFGGGHDNGYLPTLTALRSEHLLDKFILLQGYRELAREIRALQLPSLNVDNLFRSKKLPSSPKKPFSPPLPFGDAIGSDILSRFLTSPASIESSSTYAEPSHNEPRAEKKRRLNQTVPLHKNDPPPCSENYLLGRCPRGDSCRYGHDYDLTDEELAILANNTMKAPCQATRKGQVCPFGNKCIYGHKCPKGPNCYHNASGKCWFKTPDAHTPLPSLHQRISTE